MSIDREIVEHVSKLAYIGLTPEEIDEVTEQLRAVLQHVSRLQNVDTDGVESTGNTVPARDAMRDDQPRPSWLPGAVLANAPAREDDMFQVQSVLD